MAAASVAGSASGAGAGCGAAFSVGSGAAGTSSGAGSGAGAGAGSGAAAGAGAGAGAGAAAAGFGASTAAFAGCVGTSKVVVPSTSFRKYTSLFFLENCTAQPSGNACSVGVSHIVLPVMVHPYHRTARMT
jgi:hypothetical protein